MKQIVPRRETVWPTRDEIALLHAALDEHGASAREAWDRWRAASGGISDPSSRRLLPLVEWNLRRGASGLPEAPGFVEHAAVESKSVAEAVAPVIAAFRNDAIAALVLKGLALGRLAYAHPGLRPMHDVDILVPRGDLGRARATLERRGWSMAESEPESRQQHLHGAAFRKADSPEVDLHTRALAESAAPGADAGLFSRAIRFDVAGVPATTLSPGDHLLVVCVHGLRWSTAPAIHWVADATLLVRRFPELDWKTFLEEAASRGLEEPLRLALRLVREEFGAEVPPAVLDALSAHSTAQSGEAIVRMSRPTLVGGLRLHWRQLAQEHPGLGPLQRLRAFPSHLKEMWALDRAWKVPFAAVRKSVIRIARER